MNLNIDKNIKQLLLLFSVFLVGLFFFFQPTFISGFARMQTDVGDTMFNNYVLEHSWRTIFDSSYKSSAWSPDFFYPLSKSLVYSDNLWGSAPIYWLFRSFSSPETAFQLWLIIIVSLNFFSFFLLVRRLGVSYWASIFGSFLFAFCLPRFYQIGHQQLLVQFFSIFALYYLVEFIETKQFKNFVLFLGLTYLQVLAGIYLGWFFLFSLGVLFLVVAIYYRDRKIFLPFLNYKILVGLVLFFIILMATFYPYFLIKKDLGSWRYSTVEQMIPRPISYFNSGASNIFYNLYPQNIKVASDNLPMSHEHRLFLGIFFIVLLFFSTFSFLTIKEEEKNKKWLSFAVISLIVFVVISAIALYLPKFDFSLWRYVYELVPGAGAIRAVTRIWTVSYLFLFLGLTIFISRVYQQTKFKIIKIGLITISVLVCLEQINLSFFSFDKFEEREIRTKIINTISLAKQKDNIDAFYLRWPRGSGYFYDYHLKAMWVSLDLGLPTINGYSGKTPYGYQAFGQPMDNCELGIWLNFKQEYFFEKNILILEINIENKELAINKQEVVRLSELLNNCN